MLHIRLKGRTFIQCHFAQRKSHLGWPKMEDEISCGKDGDCPPDSWQGQRNVKDIYREVQKR